MRTVEEGKEVNSLEEKGKVMREADEKIFLVYGEQCQELVAEIEATPYGERMSAVPIAQFIEREMASETDRVLACGSSIEIKQVLERASEIGFSVALLAQKHQNTLRSTFRIPKELEASLKLALETTPKPVDLLRADKEIVLWGALVGDAPPLTYSSAAYRQAALGERLQLLLGAFRKLRRLRQSQVRLVTAKRQEIETAAVGIVIIEHDNRTGASLLIKDHLSVSDGKLAALLLSPKSIVDYLHYLYVALFKRAKSGRLPDSVGLIKTERLHIESTPPLQVMVDGEKVGQTPVEFEVNRQAVKLIASEEFWSEAKTDASEKETLRLAGLPANREEVDYAQKRLPLFTHASEERYRDLFAELRSRGRIESTYIVLMFLSAILATVGLFLDSASVVIGAMLLAPLMQPIVSLSMGVLRSDQSLLFGAMRSVLIGISIALVSAATITLLLPLETLTNEISARTSPSLLDLMVALVSGIAAAYAQNNQKIVGSLAGVAIAVALVPPLATAGIGLGWMNLYVFYQAFLLFLTNFVGIVFAASLTFLVLGFSPIRRAKRGLSYALATALIVAIPLYLSFSTMAFESRVLSILDQKHYIVSGKEIQVENVMLEHADVLVVKCDLVVKEALGQGELLQFKKALQQELGVPIVLEVVQRVRL